MNESFAGKAAPVTGAGSGMGLAPENAFAEEIVAAVLWLCSPGASFVVGHALLVDGGYTVR